jgi:hypothetical protein
MLFPGHKYEVFDGRICYKFHGQLRDHLVGYMTAFACLKEHEAGKISDASVNARLPLTLDCSMFSYAEVPKGYPQILGVTGALSCLGEFERTVISDDYGIGRSTYTPSVYGDSKLLFRSDGTADDVHVEKDEAQWQRKINEEILAAIKKGRATLVYFEDEAALNQWKDSEFSSGIKTLNVITEAVEADGDKMKHYVGAATRSGAVTLLTRVHGRGLDFVCHDEKVEEAGGVLVVQTFLSIDHSEEIQIRGRTARQGKAGQFVLVLDGNRLETSVSLTPEAIKAAQGSSRLYQTLHAACNRVHTQHAEQQKRFVAGAAVLREATLDLQRALLEHHRTRCRPSLEVVERKLRRFIDR